MRTYQPDPGKIDMKGGLTPMVTPVNALYWEGTSAGELRLRRCGDCDALFRFVRELCPQCWSANLGWLAATGRGTVLARAIVHVAPYDAMADRVPYVLALVELAEGPTMMANVLECDPETVVIGQNVELFFENRDGFAIPQFRPAGFGTAG